MTIIRVARIEDCKRCAELSRIEELRTATGGYLGESYLNCFVDDDNMFLVAEEDGILLGYILGEPMKGKVASASLFTVDQKHRGKGIGKMLIEAFRKRCDEVGVKYIILYAPKNDNTLEFYRKRGFVEGNEYVHFLDVRE